MIVKFVAAVFLVAVFYFIGIFVPVSSEPIEGEGLIERYDRQIREAQDITGKTAEEAFPSSMTEQRLQRTLYYMLNTWVEAEWKWNVYEITEERTERLLEVVRSRNSQHTETYLDILLEWQNDNFSNSLDNHNEIREIVGMVERSRALRLFTEEEAEVFREQGYPLPQDEE